MPPHARPAIKTIAEEYFFVTLALAVLYSSGAGAAAAGFAFAGQHAVQYRK
jgi:hypothetical protein